MQRFTDLNVWYRSHVPALEVCPLSMSPPREERFGLTFDLRLPPEDCGWEKI